MLHEYPGNAPHGSSEIVWKWEYSNPTAANRQMTYTLIEVILCESGILYRKLAHQNSTARAN